MSFETKLLRIFNSYKASRNPELRLELGWMDMFKEYLSNDTKNRIAEGNLHLSIYAWIFRECIENRKSRPV